MGTGAAFIPLDRTAHSVSRILFADEHILAADKPAGWETVAAAGGRRCFSSRARRVLKIPALAPVHRLDRDTTGVQVFAQDQETRARLEKLFRRREVHKSYLAISLGIPENRAGTIHRRLSAWHGGRRPVRVVKSGGLPAETAYRLLVATPRTEVPAKEKRASSPDAELGTPNPELTVSLILFLPRQGRTHQVRVHAEALGLPLLGDDQYGDRAANARAKKSFGLKRQALHAWRLTFTHPLTGKDIRLEAPLPADLRQAVAALFPNWEKALGAVAWE